MHVLPVSAWVLGLLQFRPKVPNTCIWDEFAHLNCPQVFSVGPAMSWRLIHGDAIPPPKAAEIDCVLASRHRQNSIVIQVYKVYTEPNFIVCGTNFI